MRVLNSDGSHSLIHFSDFDGEDSTHWFVCKYARLSVRQ